MKVLALRFSVIAAGISLLLLAGSLLPRTQADEYNKKTIFTFSGPFEVPGLKHPTVLPAGTYQFKLLDSIADRNIVQIFNKNGTHLYDTIIAIPDYRMKPTGKTIVRFEERAEGSPEAIKAWFYPGNLYGQEFVYPRSRARELAKANHEAVLSVPDVTAADMTKPIKTSTEPNAVALEKAPLKAEEPSGGETDVASVVGTQPATLAKR